MKVIVGLGNPGEKYAQTRHNIGFLTVDRLAEKMNISLDRTKFNAAFGESIHHGEKVVLLKPLTYMNRSGESVSEVIQFFKCSHENFLFIYDDLDLPFGQIRLRLKGGSGGHNGVKSIIEHLGTKTFKRIRMGIGRPEHGDVTAYVLSAFQEAETDLLQKMLDKASDACVSFLEEDFSKVMNMYNRT